MSKMNSLRVGALFLILATPALSAKTPPPVQDPLRLNLTIESHLIRFATRGAAVDWRLKVADQQDQEVFDSQFETGSALDWPLVNAQGQDVESGLYTYTLTIGSSGSGAFRTRKGLLLVQRTAHGYDVRAISDQQSALAADGETLVTVTGTADFAAEPPRDAAAPSATPTTRSPLPTNLGVASFVPSGNISGTGTTGNMTKWIDGPAAVVGDARVTELNGTVTVGDGSFVGNVHIVGPAGADVFSGMGPDLVNGPAFNYGYAGASFGRSAGFFNVRPDASAVAPNPSLRFATANVPRMIITNTGSVGIGTTSPNLGQLQVVSPSSAGGQIQVGQTNTTVARRIVSFGDNFCAVECVYVGEEDVDDRLILFANDSVRVKSSILAPNTDGSTSLGTATNRWSAVFAVNGTIQTSDARLKTSIEGLSYGLDTLMKLRPVTFEWKKSDSRRHLGLLAQEVEGVIPEVVYRDADPNAPIGLSYGDLVPVLVKALQEERQQRVVDVEKLQAENAAMLERLGILERLMQRLENQSTLQSKKASK